MINSVSLHTKLYCRLVFTLFFSSLIINVGSSQEVWNVDRFLNFDQENERLPFQQNLDFLERAKGMPFVDRYEFRTETDEMEFEPLLTVAERAWFKKTGTEYQHTPLFSLEMYANKANWPD